jgi:prepilin-type N-terminal cleavage/methylation domain-containing protein
MKTNKTARQSGFTLVELLVAIIVLGIVVISFYNLFAGLIHSAVLMKRKSVALTLATNQMEYLKSLPYNNLAVVGGSIITSNPIPATATYTIDGVVYTVRTSINYLDDAFDGCGYYPNNTLKQAYCRNYAYANNNSNDLNPADYKSVHIKVTDTSNLILSEVDTQIAARVAETNSNTGGMFVNVIDENGDPLEAATVHLVNTTTTPAVNISDTTDSNGNAIFFSLPPDPNSYDYNITASMSGYSTLTTIAPSGSLQPNYSNQKVINQQSSLVTLQLKPQGVNSLWIEAVDTSGNPLNNVKIYVKGGYKKYTSSADTSYYFDNMTPSDTRPTTDASGNAFLTNLVPGNYYFCGDAGATNCKIGSTTYYLASAVPYGGVQSLGPIMVPTYLISNPPSQSFTYSGTAYLQKVRLILTTNSNYSRVYTVNPYSADLTTAQLNNFAFTVTGQNLPCNGNPSNCSTTVKLLQGASIFTASCTGSNAGLTLSCTVDISTAVAGMLRLQVTANGNTLTLPDSPLLGGVLAE